jgi:predicted N-acetyltransferase YhbS
MEIVIRQEKREDYPVVYDVVRQAFTGAAYSDGTEQDLVERLRGSRAFIPALSLVAEVGHVVVGYILFTKASVGSAAVLALAPLAVLPTYQQHGIGSRLVETGHRLARQLGYAYSVVLGSDTYYPRFGYVPAGRFGIERPSGFPEAYFMAVPLGEKAPALSGRMQYAPEFGI